MNFFQETETLQFLNYLIIFNFNLIVIIIRGIDWYGRGCIRFEIYGLILLRKLFSFACIFLAEISFLEMVLLNFQLMNVYLFMGKILYYYYLWLGTQTLKKLGFKFLEGIFYQKYCFSLFVGLAFRIIFVSIFLYFQKIFGFCVVYIIFIDNKVF